MADENTLSGKVGLDVTDYKTGVATMNREMRVLESSFRASTASLGDWAKSATGLESRIDSLSKIIEVQKRKVEETRKEYERVKAEKGENSRAAQDLEIKLNKETETLGKMTVQLSEAENSLGELKNESNDAGNAADELGDKVDDAGNKAGGAGGKFEGFKSVLSGMGAVVKGTVVAITAIAVAVGAVTAAIGGLVFSAASASAELVDLSAQTGISTTRLQELRYAGEQLGTSQETITGSMAKMIRAVDSATNQYDDYSAKMAEAAANGEEFDGELGDKAAAFQQLGVSLTDASGQLRDSESIFADTIAALGRVGNETERDALSMSIFGKSAMELNPLIKAGSGELARLSEEAHKVGAVMSEEDVAAFEAFDDTMASLKMGLQGTLGTLGAAFLPTFQSVFDQAGGYLSEFSSIVSGSNGDFGAMAEGIGGLVGKIITDISAQAPQMLQAGLDILQSIITAIVSNLPTILPAAIGIVQSLLEFIITNLPTIIGAGLQILIALVNGISQSLPTLIPTIVQALITIVTTLVENLPMLIDAGLQILIALVSGISQSLPTLIPAIVQALITIVTTLVENLPMLIDAALQLILALAEGLITALPILIAALPQIIQSILDALIDALPMIFSAAGELIGMLATGIVANIPLLLAAVGTLAVGILEALWRLITKLPEIGKAILDGIWQGIQANAGKFWDQVKGFFSDLMSQVKSSLGIQSPSQLFADEVGAMIPPGVGKGIQNTMPSLHRQLNSAMQSLTNDFQIGMSANLNASGSGVGSGFSAQIGDIIINVGGSNASPIEIGRATEQGVLRALRSAGAA